MAPRVSSRQMTVHMFIRHHPKWRGRFDMKTESHSRQFTVMWDGQPIGVVRQFIPVGMINAMGPCRHQAVDMDGKHVGPEVGYRERIYAIEELIWRAEK